MGEIMGNIVLIQGSLNPNSKTAILVETAAKLLQDSSIANEIIDMRTIELEFCVNQVDIVLIWLQLT